MPKRSSKKPASDPNVAAYRLVARLTESPTDVPVEKPAVKNPAAVALGRLGGLKGGSARAAKLSPKRRAAIARKAAQARWGNKKA